jgi:Protein of unknown function (DUF1257)
MSHLSSMKTSFQKLIYLEKALTKLNIRYTTKDFEEKHTRAGAQRNLIIPQSNQYDLEFAWNKNSYELVVDLSFWAQPYPIEIFLEKVTQKYAMENLVGESQKLGFQVINSQKNLEGLTEFLIERWRY